MYLRGCSCRSCHVCCRFSQLMCSGVSLALQHGGAVLHCFLPPHWGWCISPTSVIFSLVVVIQKVCFMISHICNLFIQLLCCVMC